MTDTNPLAPPNPKLPKYETDEDLRERLLRETPGSDGLNPFEVSPERAIEWAREFINSARGSFILSGEFRARFEREREFARAFAEALARREDAIFLGRTETENDGFSPEFRALLEREREAHLARQYEEFARVMGMSVPEFRAFEREFSQKSANDSTRRTKMRGAELADSLLEQWLLLTEYRDHVSAARPSLTGYVSECCGTETRDHRGNLRCVHCGRICSTKSWHSPLSSSTSRGGWDPSKREQVMYLNPTRTRNTGAEDTRRAIGADRIRELGRLFDSRPRDHTRKQWDRTLRVWKLWLHVRCYAEVANLARIAGYEWTEIEVCAWVREGRAVVLKRLQREKKRAEVACDQQRARLAESFSA